MCAKRESRTLGNVGDKTLQNQTAEKKSLMSQTDVTVTHGSRRTSGAMGKLCA